MANSAAKICIVCHREFAPEIQECPFDLVRLTEKDARIGTIFDGKYEILDFIGVGGLSRVYKARHIELNRLLALKILKSSELIDLKRFRREAMSVAQLEHENIARVYSFSVSPQGIPYMVLEYLDGGDLGDLIAKEGALKPELAVNIFLQVAAALVHAHSRNIIHRDIKPGNIVLLTTDLPGKIVKVVDFGLSKLLLESDQEIQRLTMDGEILGTRQYISPEQYAGKEADERADVFALGVTMKEAVEKDGKIPDSFQPIIERATQIDPEKRIQSSKALLEELVFLRDAMSQSGMHIAVPHEVYNKKSKRDLFGTVYLWSMLIGMIIVGVCAAVVVKQRMTALEVLSRPNNRTTTVRWKPLSIEATRNQADALATVGKVNEAINLYIDWIKRNENYPEKWESICTAHRLLAGLQARLNKTSDASKTILHALEIARVNGSTQLGGYEKSPEYIALLSAASSMEVLQVHFEDSIKYSEKVLELSNDAPRKDEDIMVRAVTYFNLSRCNLKLGKLSEAKQFAEKGIDFLNKYGEKGSPLTGEGLNLLSSIFLEEKNYEKALVYANQAIHCIQNNRGRYDPSNLLATTSKATVLMKMNKREMVEQDYEYVKSQLPRSDGSYPGLEGEIRRSMRKLAEYLNRQADLPLFQDPAK